MRQMRRRWGWLVAAWLFGSMAWAGLPDLSGLSPAEDEFLPAAQAFRFQVETTAQDWRLHGTIAPGYYLYHERLSVRDGQGQPVRNFRIEQTPDIKDDPNFGQVRVYHRTLDLVVPRPAAEPLVLSYQGCAEAGLCYPPQRLSFGNTLAPIAARPPVTVVRPASTPGPTPPAVAPLGLGQASLGWIVLTFLGLGIGLSLTPCVFPMIPILAGIIAGQAAHTLTVRRGFGLALAYVVGMASSYALLGALVGAFGAQANLSVWLQRPVVLVGFAAVFGLLSLSMFGFYDLQLPSGLRDRLDAWSQRQRGGVVVGVWLMGAISSLVVSPCVSAPLAGALVYISTSGDGLTGALALFALGLGMGGPLLLLGASGGRLLPRAGNWMLVVKAMFGVGLLAVAISLLGRVLPPTATLALWGALALGLAVWLRALEPLLPAATWRDRSAKLLGLITLTQGVLLLIGAALGADNVWQPLSPLQAKAAPAMLTTAPDEPLFRRLHGVAALDRALAEARARHQPVLVDFYADWCTACQVMERSTFRAPTLRAALAPYVRLQLDVTANTEADRAAMARYRVFGPPALLRFDADGQRSVNGVHQGELTAEELLTWLQGAAS